MCLISQIVSFIFSHTILQLISLFGLGARVSFRTGSTVFFPVGKRQNLDLASFFFFSHGSLWEKEFESLEIQSLVEILCKSFLVDQLIIWPYMNRFFQFFGGLRCKTPNYPYLQEEGQKSNCTGKYYRGMIGRKIVSGRAHWAEEYVSL